MHTIATYQVLTKQCQAGREQIFFRWLCATTHREKMIQKVNENWIKCQLLILWKLGNQSYTDGKTEYQPTRQLFIIWEPPDAKTRPHMDPQVSQNSQGEWGNAGPKCMGSGRAVENYVKAIWKLAESLDINSLFNHSRNKHARCCWQTYAEGKRNGWTVTAKQKKGKAREISPLELGFKSPRGLIFLGMGLVRFVTGLLSVERRKNRCAWWRARATLYQSF